jgi:hypothetical protein
VHRRARRAELALPRVLRRGGQRLPCDWTRPLRQPPRPRSCSRATRWEEGCDQLEIYRAKQVTTPRPESQEQLGTRVAVHAFLGELRKYVGVETAYHVPAPNSGLSARVPVAQAA